MMVIEDPRAPFPRKTLDARGPLIYFSSCPKTCTPVELSRQVVDLKATARVCESRDTYCSWFIKQRFTQVERPTTGYFGANCLLINFPEPSSLKVGSCSCIDETNCPGCVTVQTLRLAASPFALHLPAP